MYQTIVWYFTAVLFLLGAVVARARKRPVTSSLERIQLTDLRDIRELLAPISTSLPILLEQRSVPNARLVRAFGITNTFVSSSVDVHATFSREARALIAGNDWDRFAQCAQLAVDKCIEERTDAGTVMRYDTLMQNAALLSILMGLFEVALDDVPIADLGVVARGINDLWKLSKTADTLPPHMLPEINTRLRAWLPAHQNPVDLIIPAFETMWRVVATTVAYTHADPLAHAVLETFLADPTSTAFASARSGTPSVDALVTEAIRLHPPTSRISRHVVSNSTKGAVLVADVGALHRDPTIWGADAEVFNPLRHQQRTPTQEKALLGFGAGRVMCVASRWAPHAAGIIVASISERIGREIQVREGKAKGGRDWDGWFVECI